MTSTRRLAALLGLLMTTQAHAVTIMPSVIETHGADFTKPLALNTLYSFSIDLYANPTPLQFVGSTRVPVHYCAGVHEPISGYCTFEIGSEIVKNSLVSVSTNILNSTSFSNGDLSFQLDESTPGTSIINFTESYIENRVSERFFIPYNDPEVSQIVGAENFTTPSSMVVDGPLSCDVVGSRSTDYVSFATTANCSLRLTFAGPAVNPGVPEPMTWEMMTAGLGVVGLFLRRKKQGTGAITTFA